MAKTRRGKGEGAVYRRGDGYWCAAIEDGRDPETGRRRRVQVVRRTKRAAVEAVAAARAERAAGVDDPQRRTVHAWLDEWAANIAPGRAGAGSLVAYRQAVERRLKPYLPDVRLGDLTPTHVRRAFTALAKPDPKRGRARGYSPASIRQARAVLVRALRVAQADGLVVRNVAELVDGPAGVRPKTDDTLTAAEARAVLAAATGDPLYPAALAVLRLGLRRGELLALRWVDVDLDAATLTVAGTLHRPPGGTWQISPPKTAGSARTLPLVGGLVEALTAHRRRQAEARLAAGGGWVDHGFVFTGPAGAPLDGSALLKWWKALTVAAGIGARRLHAARHTAATLLIEEGAPLEVVAAVLGHSSIRTTNDTYVRVRGDVMRQSLTRVATPTD